MVQPGGMERLSWFVRLGLVICLSWLVAVAGARGSPLLRSFSNVNRVLEKEVDLVAQLSGAGGRDLQKSDSGRFNSVSAYFDKMLAKSNEGARFLSLVKCPEECDSACKDAWSKLGDYYAKYHAKGCSVTDGEANNCDEAFLIDKNTASEEVDHKCMSDEKCWKSIEEAIFSSPEVPPPSEESGDGDKSSGGTEGGGVSSSKDGGAGEEGEKTEGEGEKGKPSSQSASGPSGGEDTDTENSTPPEEVGCPIAPSKWVFDNDFSVWLAPLPAEGCPGLEGTKTADGEPVHDVCINGKGELDAEENINPNCKDEADDEKLKCLEGEEFVVGGGGTTDLGGYQSTTLYLFHSKADTHLDVKAATWCGRLNYRQAQLVMAARKNQGMTASSETKKNACR